MLTTLDIALLNAAARRDWEAIKALGYKTNGEWPGPDFFEAIPYFQDVLVKNNGTQGFDSWIVVEKGSREIVGGIGFLGNPGPDGNVELGFATNESQRRKGYCLEAAEVLIEWALQHPGVKSILARSESNNVASNTLLTKLGFEIDHQDTGLIHWRYGKACYT